MLWLIVIGCGGKDPVDQSTDTSVAPVRDEDHDGVPWPTDCNDLDASISPQAAETCNGVDDDCDGIVDNGVVLAAYPDGDGDGFGEDASVVSTCQLAPGFVGQGGDCDDDDPSIHPGALEACDTLGVDEDCDGLVNEDDPDLSDAREWAPDDDGDGFGDATGSVLSCETVAGMVSNAEDCDDTNSSIHPDAQEVCDDFDVDEDCDGLADELDLEGAVGASTWYADADLDGYGDAAVATFSCADDVLGVDNDIDCDDTDPSIHPAANEDCSDGLDNDCDGEPDNCGPLDTLSLVDADAVLVGAIDWGWAGYAVTAVDINGDGIDDVATGAAWLDDVVGGEGAVYLTEGPHDSERRFADGDYDAVVWGEEWEYLGYDLARAGDLDGDGYEELFFTSIDTDNGTIWMVDGPLTGAMSSPDMDARIDGETDGDTAGHDIDAGMDLDGDGYGDLVVGAPYRDDGGSGSGSVYLVMGPVSGGDILDVAHARISGAESTDYLGYSTALVGDFDGDGLGEYAAGAHRTSINDYGTAYVFSSTTALFDGSVTDHAIASYVGGTYSAYAGYAMSAAGDHNLDGYADLLVGAPNASDIETGGGSVYLVLGGGPGGEHDLMSEADAVVGGGLAWAGVSMDGRGDVNRDGWTDILVGLPYMETGAGDNVGGAAVVLGPIPGAVDLLPESRLLMEGERANDEAGWAARFLGDQDGDGRDEMLLGSPFLGGATYGHAGDPGGVYIVGGDRS